MSALAPTEILALARILGELDYYQLLHLKQCASPAEVKTGYHATSRAFHPDANRHHEAEIGAAIEKIAMRVTEAYSVLRNPRRRQAYDSQRSCGGGIRIRLGDAESVGERQQSEAREGRTRQGRQFFNLAMQDLARQQYAGAVRNLQTALTFEPGNELFEQRLAEAREKLETARD
ncbi:MAG: DnaJ domain-containing protein [Myxococcota bacterium]